MYDYDVLNDIVPYDIVDIDGGNYQSYTVNNYYTLGDYAYCIYGDSPMSRAYKLAIYDANNYNMIFDLDFTGFRYLPNCENNMFVEQEIRWAQIEDGILYVATSHRTYAESSDYVNGFITALDMYNNFEVIWQTESLVCNSRNFIILDQNIVCGYGFTEEKDYLVEIDKTNGEVVDKVLLDSMVEFIYYKENRMYVRTYDTNYVFEVSFG